MISRAFACVSSMGVPLGLLAAAALALQDPTPPPRQEPVPASQAEGDPDARAIEQIERIAAEAAEQDELVGLAIVVARGAEPILAKGWGYASASEAVPATEDTVFRLGAISRLFTHVAALQLVQAKKLALDDELAKLVREFPTQGNKLTVHHLLSHTSGIPAPKGLPEGWHRRGRKDIGVADLIASFADEPFEFAPGTGFAPNDANTSLLGAIVEKVAGVEFAEYMDKNLFLPLGLRHTHLCDALPSPELAEPIDANAPKPKDLDEGEKQEPEEVEAEGEHVAPRFHALGLAQRASTQDVCSSAMDLFLWQRALVERAALDEETSRLLSAPIELEDGTALPHGYGLSSGEPDGVPVLTHGPRETQGSACVAYYPEADLTVVVLANGDQVDASELERRVARAVLDLREPGIVDRELSPEERALYVGAYQMGSTRVLISDRGGRLTLDRTDLPDLELLFQGHHAFVAKDDQDTSLEFKVEEGRASEFVLRRKGFETVAKRFD